MKVTIIVGGRFHAFNLAEELHRDKFLKQLITSYPKSYIKKNFKVEDDLIRSLPLKEILFRSLKKINLIEKYFDIDLFTSNIFDVKASKYLDFDNTDIILGWSSFSLRSFELAKKYNCIKILERGSSHIEYQKDILKEEYDLIGLNPKIPSPKLIDKEKKEYDLSNYISVPSEFAKKSFLEKGFDKNKIVKIPYGVDLNNFFLSNKSKNDYQFNIICVGAISVRKGVIYLIKAFNELNLKNSELILIGDIEKGFEKILKPFLNDNVKIINSVDQNSLRTFYNKSSVFVTCSIEDGFGMVILQAMACALPVIATHNTGGSEIVDDGIDGYVLPIRDVEKLKEKILFLYQNRNHLLSMSKKAEMKAQTLFSWKNYGDKIKNFYSYILKKN